MGSTSPPGELITLVAEALEAAGIPYMLTGSVASGLHGRLRSTHDVDVVIDPPDAAGSVARLLDGIGADDFYADAQAAEDAIRFRRMFNVVHHASGWKVGFIVKKARPFSEAEFARRRRVRWGGRDLLIASAEDTVVAKLEWSKDSGSARQLEDVAAILAVQGDALDRAYIERWVPELGLAQPWAAAQEQAGRPPSA